MSVDFSVHISEFWFLKENLMSILENDLEFDMIKIKYFATFQSLEYFGSKNEWFLFSLKMIFE